MYGVPATASNVSVDDEAAAEASDVGGGLRFRCFGCERGSPAAILLAKAYFDPSQGCYVKALKEGKSFMAS